MNLFKLINRDMTQLLEVESSSLADKVKEHNELGKRMAVLGKITKAIGSRIKELTTEMIPIVKEMDMQMKTVDNVILKYKEKKGTTSVSYKAGVEKALEIVNKKQQAVLNEFIASITKKGSASDVLEVADPDLANFIKDLKDIEPEDLVQKIGEISKFPKQIRSKKKRETKESLEEGFVDKAKKAIKKLVNIYKMMFSKVEKKANDSAMAIDDLVRAVGDGTVNESILVEGDTSNYIKNELKDKFKLTDAQVKHMQNAVNVGIQNLVEYVVTAHNAVTKEDTMSALDIKLVQDALEDFILNKLDK